MEKGQAKKETCRLVGILCSLCKLFDKQRFLSMFTLEVSGSSNGLHSWILSMEAFISHVQHIDKLMRIGEVMGK